MAFLTMTRMTTTTSTKTSKRRDWIILGLLLVIMFVFLGRITIPAMDWTMGRYIVMEDVAKHVEKNTAQVGDNLVTTTNMPTTNLTTLDFKSRTTCLDPEGPVPVVYVSSGRSGSSTTWEVLGSLTGKPTKKVEYTGSNGRDTLKFFEQKVGNDLQGDWILKYLCSKQKKNRKGGAKVVGFLWKPYRGTFTAASAIATWERMSQIAQDSTAAAAAANGTIRQHRLKLQPILVVRTRRNALDTHLSGLKHKSSQGSTMRAHCAMGDTKCLKIHEKAMKGGITVPNVSNLYRTLKDLVNGEDATDDHLRSYHIPTVFASYEALYYPNETQENSGNGTASVVDDDSPADEWNRILDFLFESKEESFHVTWKDVKNAMTLAPTTSSRWHNDLIANFDEVYEALKGTDMEGLLRNNQR